MTAFRKNILANYAGQGWSALMGLVFIPAYIKLLGMEAYGLIGLFAVLQAWMTLLDMGMSTTLNRETASFNEKDKSSAQRLLNILRSFEWICFLLSIAIVLIIWLLSSKISTLWLKVESVPLQTITDSIKVMGFIVAARLWEELYKGIIRGLQHQIWLNTVQATFATLRWGGALMVLCISTPTLEYFFKWQLFISIVGLFTFAYKSYSLLPYSFNTGKFCIHSIREIKNFAGGMALITLLSLLLTQIDKLLLSGILPLREFGYYSLASVVAASLMQLILPMNAAVYPKFTELVSTNNKEQLTRAYHYSCQLLSSIIIPTALILSVFAKQVLLLWSGDTELIIYVAPILSIMVIGTLLNGFMNIPYMLQLAYGWTSLTVIINSIATIIIVPLILFLVPRFGAIGAAWIWLLLNAVYAFIGIHFMFLRLLREQKVDWYMNSILKPLTTGVIVAVLMKGVLPDPVTKIEAAYLLTIVAITLFPSVALSTPLVRNILTRQLRQIFKDFN